MTGVLLDTHVALWLLDDNRRLGAGARQLIEDAAEVYLSAASRWELRIKSTLGKLRLPAEFDAGCAAAGLRDLPVAGAHADAITPDVLSHQDPFDVMLVTQAKVERLAFVTADQKILGAGVGAIDGRR